MSAINQVVPKLKSHIHEQGGYADMENKVPSKQFDFGNTKVIIYSPLVDMTKEERQAWFQEESEKKNPVLMQIARAVEDCYLD